MLTEAGVRSQALAVLVPLLLGFLGATPVAAQQVEAAPLPRAEVTVDLERLKQRLASLPATDDNTGLKLNFFVQVYGRLPRINPLEGFELTDGPVPFGGPTHGDLLSLWTPEEFSAPVADFGSVLGWFLGR
jgi:hypothetical protein